MRPGRLAYRARQFARAFTVKVHPQEWIEVERLLSPGELALFYGMTGSALRHGLAVYRHLRRMGTQDRDLLAAALLHDVGKGRLTVAHRVAAVVLEAIRPGQLKRVASPQGPGWRRGLYDHLHHQELGAELAQRAGSSAVVVDLIRHHHQDGRQGPPGLAALQMADEGA